MIISQRRQSFDGKTVLMPDWMRAPLYLQGSARCWVAHRPAATSRRQTIYEVVLSSIDKVHWPHLWKLKLTTRDEAGTAEKLCSVFADHDIEVLTAESSVHTLNRYNSMSFILSMAEYQNELDGGHQHHSAVSTHRLEFLELLLLSSMSGHVVFHRSGKPRFELTPMRLYSQMEADRLEAIETIVDPKKNGRVDIPARVCSKIARCCGSEHIFFSGAVDTENRVIRILFFPEGSAGVAYIQISASEMNTKVIQTVLRHLKALDANVIRFQVRRGLNDKKLVADFAIDDGSKAGSLGPGRMDLTLESTTDAVPAEVLVSQIKAAIENDATLTEYNAHVTHDKI